MSDTSVEPGAFAVVAGGGTAGHVLPALALIDGLVAAGHPLHTLHYAGAWRGVETRLVPPHGVPHTFFDVIGLQRRLTPSNLRFPVMLLRAVRQAGRLLATLRPRVVVSVGGYASLPIVLAARRRRIPIVVVSYDRRPGRASELTARMAAVSAVAFADSPLPRARHTGAPVRRDVLAVDRSTQREAARRELGVPADRFLISVVGGSQGSGALNQAVTALTSAWAADATLAVRHVVGTRFLEQAMPARHDESGMLYQVIGFEERMPQVYAASDLVVARGGASTVIELAVTGTPSVLVPWGGAADDHQRANVAWLVEAGAAVTLDDADLDRLGAVVESLRSEPGRLAAMSRAAHEAGAVHRSGDIVAVIEDVAS